MRIGNAEMVTFYPAQSAHLALGNQPGGNAAGLRRGTTPARLRRLLTVVLALVVLLWLAATLVLRGLGDAAASARATAAPAYLGAVAARAALSDADRAAWLSFRSGEAQLTGPGPQYQNDITAAGQDLEQLAALEPRGSAGAGQLQTISGQLVSYQGLVEQADAANRADIALGAASHHDLGLAYLTYASDALRDGPGSLLANVSQLARTDRQALAGQLAPSWASPLAFAAAGAAGLAALAALAAAQVVLRRRFRRAASPPLLLAAALVCALVAWLAAVTLPAGATLGAARGSALPEATAVWQAQASAADAAAAALRAGGAGTAPAIGPPGAAASAAAGRALDADLATAQDSGGLAIGLPIMALAIAGLAGLAIWPRLSEYRG
jgi:hypothetical protein